ncbi:MAG TPA: hypothetical protein VFA43_07155 [Gemmatimonadaceae bacterium]|nr:hypothetical protein [Gemmatimonadaceae bacterium]
MLPLHGIEITGTALGFTQASIAIAVILCAVVPALGSVVEVFVGQKKPMQTPIKFALGELIVALILFSASGRVLHDSIHAHIVGTGDERVLAVRASATTEVVQ